MTHASAEDLAQARALLRHAGFPVDEWDDAELKSRMVVLNSGMVSFARALRPMFTDSIEGMGDLFRKLAIVAEAIDAEERL